MCGLFGWVTKNGNGPDLGRLRRIAIETQTRGNHAFGFAWLGTDGRIRSFKRPGPATANLGDLDRVRDALIVVGHCRYATHGDPRDNRTNHPHRAGRGMICHNGVVANHASLIRRYPFGPRNRLRYRGAGAAHRSPLQRPPGAAGGAGSRGHGRQACHTRHLAEAGPAADRPPRKSPLHGRNQGWVLLRQPAGRIAGPRAVAAQLRGVGDRG